MCSLWVRKSRSSPTAFRVDEKREAHFTKLAAEVQQKTLESQAKSAAPASSLVTESQATLPCLATKSHKGREVILAGLSSLAVCSRLNTATTRDNNAQRSQLGRHRTVY